MKKLSPSRLPLLPLRRSVPLAAKSLPVFTAIENKSSRICPFEENPLHHFKKTSIYLLLRKNFLWEIFLSPQISSRYFPFLRCYPHGTEFLQLHKSYRKTILLFHQHRTPNARYCLSRRQESSSYSHRHRRVQRQYQRRKISMYYYRSGKRRDIRYITQSE